MSTPARKLAVVAMIAALTTGASGYFMGLLQSERSAARRAAENASVTPAPAAHFTPALTTAPEAPRYADLRDRSRQPNHRWQSSLASLPPAPAFTLEQARTRLAAGLLLGVQIRYAYEGHAWTDTLLRRPAGLTLVRIREADIAATIEPVS